MNLSTETVSPVNVTVADGRKILVAQAVSDVHWTYQGAKFNTSFRVFDLPHYDIIFGMEWLDTLGPMWVDWHKETFRIK
jgi:hypothetical protein